MLRVKKMIATAPQLRGISKNQFPARILPLPTAISKLTIAIAR
jgi:hypothetical protein